MNRILDCYCKVLHGVIAALLAVMIVLVFGNVVLRYLFNSGLTVSEEMARWMFVWIIFLGSLAALHTQGHLGTDLVVSRFSPRAQRVCRLLVLGLMLWMSWLILDGSWQQMRINWKVSAPGSGASMAIFYASGVVFAASAIVILAWQCVLTLAGRAPAEQETAATDAPT